MAYLSEKINQRAFLGMFAQFWFLPCIIALAVLPDNESKWGTYALLTVLLSYPSGMLSHLREEGKHTDCVQSTQFKLAGVTATRILYAREPYQLQYII
jgi:hypothetical protein